MSSSPFASQHRAQAPSQSCTLREQAVVEILPASECGAREDCIYFVCDYDDDDDTPDPTRDCGVFDMKSGVITPLLPDTVVARQRGCEGRPAAWFSPTKTM
jgi:hypothetical protein